MKIAHVGQPWDLMLPSHGNITTSIAVIIVNSAKELRARGHDVIIYCPGERFSMRKRVETADGITYRAMGMVRLEKQVNSAVNRIWQSVDPTRPFSSKLAHRLYAEQIARDLKSQQVDIVHLHNMFQFAPPIRAANPRVKIVLHMLCEWLVDKAEALYHELLSGQLAPATVPTSTHLPAPHLRTDES
jgi:UDP:flavonoid glycosyltransferase YjiC (YdhE family)